MTSGTGSRLGLFTRLMLAVTVAVAAVVGLFAERLDARARRTYVADRGVTLRNRAAWTSDLLRAQVVALRRDAVLLSLLPSVQGLAAPALGRAERAGLVTRLEAALFALAAASPGLTSVRYAEVAGNGRELVRLDVDGGSTRLVPPDSLGTVAGTGPWTAALTRPAGSVYISGIERRGGTSNTASTRRVITATTPVFGGGTPAGVIMIEHDIGPWIDSTARMAPSGVLVYVADEQGNDLGAAPPAGAQAASLGWLLPDTSAPGIDTATHWDRLTSGPQAVYAARSRIHFDPDSPSRFLALAFVLSDSAVAAALAPVRFATIVGSTSVAVTLILGGALLVAWALAPLRRLNLVAQRIGAGDYDAALPDSGGSDLGSLTGAFRSMIDGIKRREEEKLRTNTALRQSEARFRQTLDDMQEGCQIIGFDWRYLYVNDSAARHGRRPAAELVGRTMTECYPGIDQTPLFQRMKECMTGRATQQFENEFAYPDGTSAWFDIVIHPAPDGVFVTSYDITDRKRAELDLRASFAASRRERDRAAALLHVVPDAVVIADPRGNVADVNAQAEVLFGYRRAELLEEPLTRLLPERARPAYESYRERLLGSPDQPRVEGDLTACRKDRTEFQAVVSLGPLVTPEGTYIVATLRDVTDQRAASRRVLQQVEHLTLLDQITRAIAERHDQRSIYQAVVTSIENDLPVDMGFILLYDGFSPTLTIAAVGAKAAGADVSLGVGELVPIDGNGLSRVITGQLVHERDIRTVGMPFTTRLVRIGMRSLVLSPLRSESRVFGVMVSARRQADAFTSTECEFLRQVTEHVALGARQSQLHDALQAAYDDLSQSQQTAMQLERLRAMAQMASGIAHDINNALSPVSLYTEVLLTQEQDLNARTREYLEQIRHSVQSVADTVARIREFSRPPDTGREPVPIQVNDLVARAVAFTHARWGDIAQRQGSTINAVTDLAPDLPDVMAIESELRDALTNLIFNAIDAMPAGGIMTLRTRSLLPVGGRGRTRVMIEVSDDGIGMDEETRLRCLEPFFTTKGDRGTGLGLAMVFGMVQRHAGRIEITSAPGQGTAIRMTFPVAEQPAGAGSGASESPTTRGPLRLLLVDDDPILLKSLRATMALDNHQTVEMHGGEAGIAAFQEALARGTPFDAVITDLGMPKVDGRQVSAAIKAMSPRTPVIMLTGWGRRLLAERDLPPHVDIVISKPPTLPELRTAIASLCGQPQPEGAE